MNLNDRLFTLNTAGKEVEVTSEEAEELGAFEETALSEQDAADSIDLDDEE